MTIIIIDRTRVYKFHINTPQNPSKYNVDINAVLQKPKNPKEKLYEIFS